LEEYQAAIMRVVVIVWDTGNAPYFPSPVGVGGMSITSCSSFGLLPRLVHVCVSAIAEEGLKNQI